MKRLLFLAIILLVATPAAAQESTATPYPTYTFYPTYTQYPTYTPPSKPTSTPPGKPTLTPLGNPTATPLGKPKATLRPGTKAKGTATPLPTVSEDVGSRTKPVPLGQSMPLSQETTKLFEIGIAQVIRGADAWALIKKANRFNDPPEEGREYLIAYVTVRYLGGPPDAQLELTDYSFKVVSNGQILDDILIVVAPAPQFKIKFFPGASGAGWVVKEVFQDDADPLLVIGMSGENKGFFFATH